MKNFYSFLLLAAFLILGCSSDDSPTKITAITLSASQTNVFVGSTVSFTVKTNTEKQVTANAEIFVNDAKITTSTYTPSTEGIYTIYATYVVENKVLTSNEITLEATNEPVTSITLSSDNNPIEISESATFSVTTNTGVLVTSESVYYVNNETVTTNVFTPNAVGSYQVKAIYNYEGEEITSNELTLEVLPESTEVTVFNKVVFYDGYAATVNEEVPSGAIRLSNASYVTELTDTQIEQFSNQLTLEVTIGALCDNYDRIGGVFLQLLPNGEAYNENNVVSRIEIGRFITPFMNKNYNPTEVPYSFDISNLAKIFHDETLKNTYDFWIEFYLFGVPYAAQDQVAGCSGRNDVFEGTLKFVSTNESLATTPGQFLTSLADYEKFNNYAAGATDVIGQTVKTISFEVSQNLTNATMYVITSNHGANSGGEEYNRREHYLYYDGVQLAMYIPGGESCEPFRQYNTQGNGIYGSGAQSDAYWASFNNWCPGDKIPIRSYDLGAVLQGTHTFKIEVPDAVFADGQGNIPLSVYVQGDLE